MQTQASDGSSRCLPNWPAMGSSGNMCGLQNPKTNKYEPVDCGKFALCWGLSTCSCTASGCTVSSDGNGSIFDLFVDGTTASGSTNGTNVHFLKK